METFNETPWIFEDQLLRAALDVISISADRTVFVVSQNYQLKGVISEGDILRAYSKGQLPNTPAIDIMTRLPVYLSVEADEIEICNLFVKAGILLIPIVDSSGVLVGSQSVRSVVKILLAKLIR